MASSRDRAISLKDNYVAGLIEGGATAPVQGMKERNFGEQASLVRDLDSMQDIFTNDGDPGVYFKQNGRIMDGRKPQPKNAMPLPGYPYGTRGRQPMSGRDAMNVQEAIDFFYGS